MKIDRHNYEEFFLLYVDNELTAEQKKSVEVFVKENPDLAKELEILQQLTLKADDEIVFEGKEFLLKNENDSFITIMNYEEYLIAYIDNELNDDERTAFEKFAALHPQVKEQLTIFQQTKLQPEEIIFKGKEFLLKKENDSFINSMNYEEYLTSYIDNELNAVERKEFEKFAALHPHIKEELAIFQQVKLRPEEEIIFSNKEVLYRREEKVRVITMQWWKIAVAAAIILAIGITTITVLNKPSSVSPGVANNNKQKTEKINPVTKTEQDIKKEQQSNPVDIKNNSDAVASTNTNDKKSKAAPVQKENDERVQKKIAEPVLNNNNNETVAKKDIPVKNSNAIIDNKSNDTKIIDAVIKKSDEPVKTNDVAMNTNLPKENINNNLVTNTSEVPYNIQTDANDTESPVAASYDEGKNKKLRGFFRKATRVFERRTNISASDQDNSDKVLIGALAVKLK